MWVGAHITSRDKKFIGANISSTEHQRIRNWVNYNDVTTQLYWGSFVVVVVVNIVVVVIFVDIDTYQIKNV